MGKAALFHILLPTFQASFEVLLLIPLAHETTHTATSPSTFRGFIHLVASSVKRYFIRTGELIAGRLPELSRVTFPLTWGNHVDLFHY